MEEVYVGGWVVTVLGGWLWAIWGWIAAAFTGMAVGSGLGILAIFGLGNGNTGGCQGIVGGCNGSNQVSVRLAPGSDEIVASGKCIPEHADESGGSGSYVFHWSWTGQEDNCEPVYIDLADTENGQGRDCYFTVIGEVGTEYTITINVQDKRGGPVATATKKVTVGPSTTSNPNPNPNPVVPTANPQSVSTAYETAVVVTLTGSPSGVTYSVVTNPSHGTLDGAESSRTYKPNDGYSGPDVFTFKVSDGKVDSTPATVSITVGTPVNPPQGSASVSLTAFPTAGGQAGDTTLNANVGNESTGVSGTSFVWNTDGGTILKGAGTNSLSMRYTPGVTIRPKVEVSLSDGSTVVSPDNFVYEVQ